MKRRKKVILYVLAGILAFALVSYILYIILLGSYAQIPISWFW